MYVYNFILYGIFAVIFVAAGYLFRIEAFTHASIWRFVALQVRGAFGLNAAAAPAIPELCSARKRR